MLIFGSGVGTQPHSGCWPTYRLLLDGGLAEQLESAPLVIVGGRRYGPTGQASQVRCRSDAVEEAPSRERGRVVVREIDVGAS